MDGRHSPLDAPTLRQTEELLRALANPVRLSIVHELSQSGRCVHELVEALGVSHLGFGDRLRVLRKCGFEVEDIIQIQAPAGATTRFDHVTPEWVHRWPSEEIWVARKRR